MVVVGGSGGGGRQRWWWWWWAAWVLLVLVPPPCHPRCACLAFFFLPFFARFAAGPSNASARTRPHTPSQMNPHTHTNTPHPHTPGVNAPQASSDKVGQLLQKLIDDRALLKSKQMALALVRQDLVYGYGACPIPGCALSLPPPPLPAAPCSCCDELPRGGGGGGKGGRLALRPWGLSVSCAPCAVVRESAGPRPTLHQPRARPHPQRVLQGNEARWEVPPFQRPQEKLRYQGLDPRVEKLLISRTV